MDNKIISIIFLFISIAQVLAINPTEGITRLKNDVTSTSSTLQRYGNNLEFNLRTKLNNLKFSQMANVNNAVNPAMTDIQNSIDKAKNEGKNADRCYEPARSALADASKLAFAQLDNCVTNQLNTLKPVTQNIDTHLLQGKTLLSELDFIVISCASGTPIQVQMCITQKMPAANNSVQNYKNVANALRSTGDSLSSSAQIDIIGCFNSQMTQLYSSVSSVRISAQTCINNS